MLSHQIRNYDKDGKDKNQETGTDGINFRHNILDSIATIQTSFTTIQGVKEFHSYLEEDLTTSLMPKEKTVSEKEKNKTIEKIPEECHSKSEEMSIQKESSSKKNLIEKEVQEGQANGFKRENIIHNDHEETIENFLDQLEAKQNIKKSSYKHNNEDTEREVREDSQEEKRKSKKKTPIKNKSNQIQEHKEKVSLEKTKPWNVGKIILIFSLLLNAIFLVVLLKNQDMFRNLKLIQEQNIPEKLDLQMKESIPITCDYSKYENALTEKEKLKIENKYLNAQINSLERRENDAMKEMANIQTSYNKIQEKISGVTKRIDEKIKVMAQMPAPYDKFADQLKIFLTLLKEVLLK